MVESPRRLVVRYSGQISSRLVDETVLELKKLANAPVESTQFKRIGPASGWDEISILVSVIGDVPFLKEFLGGMAAGAGEAVWRALTKRFARVAKEGPKSPYVPIGVQFGTTQGEMPVRFYIHDSPSPEELVKRLQAAHEIIASLPNEMFSGRSAPPEYGLWWDVRAGRWRGTIWRDSGEHYGDGFDPRDAYHDETDE